MEHATEAFVGESSQRAPRGAHSNCGETSSVAPAAVPVPVPEPEPVAVEPTCPWVLSSPSREVFLELDNWKSSEVKDDLAVFGEVEAIHQIPGETKASRASRSTMQQPSALPRTLEHGQKASRKRLPRRLHADLGPSNGQWLPGLANRRYRGQNHRSADTISYMDGHQHHLQKLQTQVVHGSRQRLALASGTQKRT